MSHADIPPQPDREDKPAHDPFEGVFREDGGLDSDVVGRRLPTLVDLLRHDETCFPLRIDFDALGRALISPAGLGLRDAGDDEELESALRDFSLHHLHEFIDDDHAEEARSVLQAIADDTSKTRKKRQAAAAGVGLVAGLPDDRGLRGRGLFDLLLRISIEELHAQEQLRQRSEEEEGLSPKELEKFWATYPALRHHYEQRYRKDVERLMRAIDDDLLPQVISVDLAVRGAHAMLQQVAASGDGGVDAERAAALLRETFEDDMLDGGRELVVARWVSAAAKARDEHATATADEEAQRRALLDVCGRAIRISSPASPGGELILFHAYTRAVVEGSFHVRDAPEAEAARHAFGDGGLDPDGLLGYAKHLAARGDPDQAQRVGLAGIELWPEHEGLRALGVVLAEAQHGSARGERQGPTYQELGETFAEIPADDDDDENDDNEGAE